MSVRQSFVPLLLGCSILAGCSSRNEAETIFVGHIAPFSGRDKAVGEHAKQGIVLAVEEINNSENQTAGRRIAVLHVDSLGEQDSLQPEAVRLITVNHVAALLGGQTAEAAERLGRASQPYGVALVTAAPLAAPPKGDNVFSVNVNQSFRGQTLARFAVNELKAHRVIVLTESRQAGHEALTAAALKEFNSAPQAQAEEWTYKSEGEFKELSDRAIKAQPQALLLAGPAADLAALRSKLQQSTAQVPLLFGGEDGLALANQANEKTLSDVYLAEAFAGDGGTPQGQEFAKKYQQRFHEPPDLHAALAYDSLRLLAEAVRQAKGTRPANVRTELAEPNFTLESLTGPLTFAPDHSARRPAFIGQVQDGRVVPVKRYEPPTP